MSAPVGPTGCEGTYADAPSDQKPWFVGVSYGQFATELLFGDGPKPALSEQMVVATAGRELGAYSVRVAAGAILGGTLEHDGRTHDVGAGWLASVTGARRWLVGPNDRVFITGTFTLAVSSTSSRESGMGGENPSVGLTAADARLGVLAGTTLWDRISPYALARVFGGPIFWELDGAELGGTDQHHYQLGLGASLRLPMGLSAQIDASLVGERSVSAGAIVQF